MIILLISFQNPSHRNLSKVLMVEMVRWVDND